MVLPNELTFAAQVIGRFVRLGIDGRNLYRQGLCLIHRKRQQRKHVVAVGYYLNVCARQHILGQDASFDGGVNRRTVELSRLVPGQLTVGSFEELTGLKHLLDLARIHFSSPDILNEELGKGILTLRIAFSILLDNITIAYGVSINDIPLLGIVIKLTNRCIALQLAYSPTTPTEAPF